MAFAKGRRPCRNCIYYVKGYGREGVTRVYPMCTHEDNMVSNPMSLSSSIECEKFEELEEYDLLHLKGT